MNENTVNQEVLEVDLRAMLSALLKKAWLVALVSLLGAVCALVITYFFITPQYQAEVTFYVNNNGESNMSISSGDITASKDLVETYIVILNTKQTLDEIMENAGVQYSYSALKEMIQASSVNETEVFRVVVTSPSPSESKALVDSIAGILPGRITSIVEGTTAKIVDQPTVSTDPSSPNYLQNILIGFLLGFVLSAGVIIVYTIFDITIRSEEDILQCCKYPILASVPNVEAIGKKDGASGWKQTKLKEIEGNDTGISTLVDQEVSFSASEAYKMLRTKLQFSFVDEKPCRIIGVSSALSSEGKSVTATNLAYVLSQLDKRVLLIDCDMRRPTVAEKLSLDRYQGLSNYLTGQVDINKLIQQCDVKEGENAFHVISAGEAPPNPVELLGSARMEKMLEILRTHYSYIVLDLPPVGEVSDALVVAKLLDGIVLVVRQNYCDRSVLSSAVQQFKFIQAKILGVVYNCTTENGGRYGSRYYRKYYGRYYKK